MRKSYHEDIVDELLTELNNGNSTPNLKETLGVLRDHSVRWMWNAYQALSNKEVVKKVCLWFKFTQYLTLRRRLKDAEFASGTYQ